MRLDEGDFDAQDRLFQMVELPATLASAVSKRRLHYRAGRYCALAALQALQPGRLFTSPARGVNGAPLWPEGVAGSLTHTDDFVSAAVALSSDAAAIGVDTERIVTLAQARDLARPVAWPSELAEARAAGCDRAEAFTLVFSAKESVFKCLHPAVGQFFGFHDVRIVHVDARARAFGARIVKSLSEAFPADTMLEGRFEIGGSRVHTGVVVPSRA